MRKIRKTLHRILQSTIDHFTGNGLRQEENSPAEDGYADPKTCLLCRQAGAEGIILLKNNGVLPLRKEQTLAVFGRCQIHSFFVGYGSGGDVHPRYKINFLDALHEAGARIDPLLASYYREWCGKHPPDEGWWGHWPMHYPEVLPAKKAVQEAAQRNEAALLVLGRAAGEDRDNVLRKGSYYLTKRERELLDRITSYFSQTIVLLNCGNLIDLAWIQEYGEKISAVLYAWHGGQESGRAAADILLGKSSPCGKLPDTVAVDYMSVPGHAEFGRRRFTRYIEDIFVGYRYFETFAREQVLYPFGFGLSYSSFKVDCLEVIRNADQFKVVVQVKNTGNYAGKEVVQLYVGAPQGKLGKPAKVLTAFQKTQLLMPGEKENLTLSFTMYDFASFDDTGASGYRNCYVIEEGTYRFFLGNCVESSREIYSFSQKQTRCLEILNEICGLQHPLERLIAVEQDGVLQKKKQRLESSQLNLKQRILAQLPLHAEFVGEENYCLEEVRQGKISLRDFIAQLVPEELEAICRGEGRMNSRLGISGNAGAFGGITKKLRKRGIPPVICTDGPAGIRINRFTTLLPCGTALAATWNPELVTQLYQKLGEEMKYYGVHVFLGCGMNLHRNPLCGRNFEYFSEDPLLTGKLACAVTEGIQSSGAAACPKHFAANNQETKRNCNDSQISQRALREIYLKGFEICVKQAKPYCLMTSYNKINGVWAHYHYDLVTEVLRKEWGFQGLVLTDWRMKKSRSPEFPMLRDNAYRIRAQVDVLMPGNMSYFAKSYKADGTAIENLGKCGGITLGELQRSAENVLRFILQTMETI